MAPPKYTPDKNTLIRWQEEGLTHQQMADRVFDTTGHRVTRAAITLEMMKHGLSKARPRYKETLPWRVSLDHIMSYPARMLRFLGKRLAGGELKPQDEEALDAWLANLQADGLIVAYAGQDDPTGFHYIDQSFKDHDNPDIPIRKKEINLTKQTSA